MSFFWLVYVSSVLRGIRFMLFHLQPKSKIHFPIAIANIRIKLYFIHNGIINKNDSPEGTNTLTNNYDFLICTCDDNIRWMGKKKKEESWFLSISSKLYRFHHKMNLLHVNTYLFILYFFGSYDICWKCAQFPTSNLFTHMMILMMMMNKLIFRCDYYFSLLLKAKFRYCSINEYSSLLFVGNSIYERKYKKIVRIRRFFVVVVVYIHVSQKV